MSDVQPSAFGCVFCPFEDDPQAVRIHLIDEHATKSQASIGQATSTASGKRPMDECNCGSDQPPRIIKRARESAGWPDAWDGVQILECRDCGRRRKA